MSKRLERFKEAGLLGCLNNSKEENMEWVSVKNRHPESYIFVLVCEKRLHEPSPISIARWEDDKWHGLGEDEHETNAFYMDLFWDISWKNISHWMPLPYPPKEKNEKS